MILSYKNFLQIFEAKKEFDTVLVMSEPFKKILKSIDTSLSKAVLDKDDTEVHNLTYTYISTTKMPDKVSFLNQNRLDTVEEPWEIGRTQVGIGKVFKAICPEFGPQDVELLVNAYKAKFAILNNDVFKDIKIVDGEKIRHYYSENQYTNGSGTLNKSCMRYAYAQKYLDIYTENPEVCKLIVLMDDEDEDKIKGRALLWKLSSPEGRKFMDRVYIINDSDKDIFVEFAKSNNWLYKGEQNSSNGNIYDPETGNFVDVYVKLKPGQEFETYPYMDTVYEYDKNGNILSNRSNRNTFELRDTNGGGDPDDYEARRDNFYEMLRDMNLRQIVRDYDESYVWNNMDDSGYCDMMMNDRVESMVDNFDDEEFNKNTLITFIEDDIDIDAINENDDISEMIQECIEDEDKEEDDDDEDNEDGKKLMTEDNRNDVLNNLSTKNLMRIIKELDVKEDFVKVVCEDEYGGWGAEQWHDEYGSGGWDDVDDFMNWDDFYTAIIDDHIE